MERMTYRQYQAVEREMRREERKRRRKKALTILVVLLLLVFVLLIFLDLKGIIDVPSVSSRVSQAWEAFRDSRQMPAQAAVEETTQVTTEEETLPPEPETTPAPTQAPTSVTVEETTQVTTEEETLPPEPETTLAPIQETTLALTPAAPAEPETTEWMYFYHWEVLEDGDSLNDYNFGCNPLDEEGAVLTAEWLHPELVRRMTDDPALGAAAMAWVEINTGVKFLPGYYNPDREGWMNIINRKIDEFILSPDCYCQCLEPFIRYLANANEVDVRACTQVTDQMYMYSDGRTRSQVVVFESKDCSGYELVYTFIIKGNVHEVAFRANCGFQPTGVTDKTNIVLPPEPEPETEPETEPVTEPETEPWVEPPTEAPTEPPTYPEKDPELASYEYVESNDDPGLGEDTNTGVGSTVSAADQPYNSDHNSSYNEQVEAEKWVEDINTTQRVGGDDNTPSYTPPVEYVTNPAEPEAEPETVPLTEHNNGGTGGTVVEVSGGQEETVDVGTVASIDEVRTPQSAVEYGNDAIETGPVGEWGEGAPPD